MAVSVGTAFVDIRPDMSGFSREVRTGISRDVGRAGDDAARSMKKSFAGIGKVAAGIFAGVQIKSFLDSSINAAGALNEQVSATGVVFAAAAAEVREFAKGSAEAFGLSQRATLETANQLGNFLVGLGATPAVAADASQSLITLAADMASLQDVGGGAQEVIGKYLSGLAGETEPLRRLGIIVSEQAVKQKALELGLGGANRELTEGEKVQARYAIIVEESSRALGNFDETSRDLANTQRTLNAQYEDAQAAIGSGLLPLKTSLLQITGQLLGPVSALAEAQQRDAASAATYSAELERLVPKSKGYGEALLVGGRSAKELASANEQVTFGLGGLTRELKLTVAEVIASEAEYDSLKDAVLGVSSSQRILEAASRAVGDAEESLADARRDYNQLLADGAVDEERVADARERLASASRSVASAERDLAKTRREYEEAQAATVALGGLDTAREAEVDALDNLIDAEDRVADAKGQEADATEELHRAQAGDPEFNQRLAEAKERVGDAAQSVADATYNHSRALFDLDGVTQAANTSLATHADEVGRIRSEWKELIDLQPGIDTYLAGPLGSLPAPTGDLRPLAGAGTQPNTAPLAPLAGTGGLFSPATATSVVYNNQTVNQTFNEKVEPQHVAREMMWALQ